MNDSADDGGDNNEDWTVETVILSWKPSENLKSWWQNI